LSAAGRQRHSQLMTQECDMPVSFLFELVVWHIDGYQTVVDFVERRVVRRRDARDFQLSSANMAPTLEVLRYLFMVKRAARR